MCSCTEFSSEKIIDIYYIVVINFREIAQFLKIKVDK